MAAAAHLIRSATFAVPMGCGPSSFANEEMVQLVWTTQPGMDCWQDQCCPGIKPLPSNAVLPPWISQEDINTITSTCELYGDCIFCQADCCGSPICDSPSMTGGQALPAVRERLPHLNFDFEARFIGYGDSHNWNHILVITPGGGARATGGVVPASLAGADPGVLKPVPASDDFRVSVPDGVSPGDQVQVTSPVTGQAVLVTVPAGVGPGQQFMARA